MSPELAPLGRLRREHILNPVTALAFYTSGNGRRCVLAGEDTDINVYDVASARLLGRLSVFRAQPIHGIAVPPPLPRGRDASAAAAITSSRKPPRSILAWGGHSVTVIPVALIEAIAYGDPVHHESSVVAGSPPVEEAKAPDWILDGAISPFAGGEDRVVLLTAHNEAIEVHGSGDGATIAFGRVRSPSRPILYSGNLAWVAEDRVLVAAGTVFGEILVWKYRPGCCEPGEDEGEGPDSSCEVLFVFAGHEGSIFGVHISPEMTRTASGDAVRLLASCSDDRTIRVWDITEGGEGSRTYDQRTSEARETGFGDTAGTVADEDSSARCLAVAMAHLSRIWHVEFPQEQRLFPVHDTVQIYSFGEDSTAQKWHLTFDKQQLRSTRREGPARDHVRPTAKLVHQSAHSNHSGKHIWSRAIHSSNGEVLVATGGSDGKVALIQGSPAMSLPDKTATQPESPSAASNGGQTIFFTLADVSRACLAPHTTEDTNPIRTGKGGDKDATHTDGECRPQYKLKNARESFQRYTFITERRILMVTNHGKLFLGTFNEASEELELEWAELPLPEEISQTLLSYSVLGSSRAKPLAFVGTTAGNVYCYDDAAAADDRLSLRPLTNVGGKVADIYCLSDVDRPSDKRLQDSSADLSNGHHTEHPVELLVTVLGLPRAVIVRLGSHLSPRQSEVTLEKGFRVTAAAFYQGHLLLGSRDGGICVLGQDATGGYSPTLTVKAKLGDAVTSIVPLPTRSDQAPGYFLATCRDGKYRIYELQITDGIVELHMLHEVTLRFISLVEGAWFSDDGSGGKDLMLCGFRGKDMVLWNETRRREIASVDCGGAHRSFAYTRISDNPEGFRFVYTKASQMHVFSQAGAPQRALKPGGHGREIKAISASPAGRYIATGAEDTAIRIWEYSHASSRDDDDDASPARRLEGFRCVAVLERHSAGIQTLKWHGDEYLFSSAGNEEFYAWRINRIDSDVCPLGTVCEAVFPDRSESGDLRIMDFDVERTITTTGYEPSHQDGGSAFCITMALSNSTLRSYTYTRRTGFSLRGRRGYTGACLTQLRHLGPVDGGGPGILAAATDGHLAIYGNVASPSDQNGETEEESRDVSVTKLHQNSVKSLDMRKVESNGETAYLVATGGDDNALGITHLHFNAAEARYEVRGRSIVKSAHAAAITGIAILRMMNGDRDAIVVSTSNDQRVKTWKLAGWQSAGLRIALLDDQYSSVADSGDLAVLDENRFVVAGVGHKIWIMRTISSSLLSRIPARPELALIYQNVRGPNMTGAVAAASASASSAQHSAICRRCHDQPAPSPLLAAPAPKAIASSRRGRNPRALASFHTTSPSLKKGKSRDSGGDAGKKRGAGAAAEAQDAGDAGDGGAKHPTPTPEDPLDFADVRSRIARHDEHYADALKKLRSGGRFNPDVLGALRVAVSKGPPAETYPLRELAQVIPRGGRAVSILAHEAGSIRAIMSAVQASPEFNQQPQRDPDNELELVMKIEPESRDDVVRRVKAACHEWRERVRRERQRRDKLHTAWRKEGNLGPDLKRTADKQLDKIIKAKMTEIDTVEKEALKAAEGK
ncbi:hypothetical protein DL762_004656 [Monosporascus cannonballus]|uniref:Ribosome recycling factor domain-containing protein n=1 Tax=Monosporascus cannonballus TaxID=155416 RepID=A0ABY0HBP2_9PEZI|nr:hypothetical protein DL762_004656 [Monosporascus cannonballus]